MKCQPKANNYREAVVVCARHVLKQPSMRMRASNLILFEGIILSLNTFLVFKFARIVLTTTSVVVSMPSAISWNWPIKSSQTDGQTYH